MPWVRALLRGQRVFARADATGRLAEAGGKVEIRYKPGDGRRYDAMARNLAVEEGSAVLPDETCAPAEAVARDERGKPAAQGRAGASAGAARPGRKKTEAPSAGARKRTIERAHAGEVLVAYTDGACSGNPGPAGLGVILLGGGEKVELGEYLGTATNNIAELTAILRALELVEDPARPLIVHTDSQYAIGVLSKGWKAKANAELIAQIREALRAHRGVELVYVPGHAGVDWNERADELARAAIAGRRTTRTRAPLPGLAATPTP